MPNYTVNHVHHETHDVDRAVQFYQDLFGATAEDPFERGGATWVQVHIGNLKVTVTNRECADMELGRYLGVDHFALNTDDFDATLKDIDSKGVSIWAGPLALEDGKRIVFINGPDHVKIELMES